MVCKRVLSSLLFLSSLAGPVLGQVSAPSIRFLNRTGQVLSRAPEASWVNVEVTDPAAAGRGWISLTIASDLRGHTVPIDAWENPAGSGLFVASVYLDPRLSTDPLSEYNLTVTEDPGPPQRFDTVRVTVACPAAPCPEATLPVFASDLHIIDAQGQPLRVIPLGATFTLEVEENINPWGPIPVTSQPGGDSETVYPFYAEGYPDAIHSRVPIPTAAGPAVPEDGVLQVEDGGTVTVNHLNSLGLTTTTLTLPTGSILEILDRRGAPVEHVLANGAVRLRFTAPGADLDPDTPDHVTAHFRTLDPLGNPRDSEDLDLLETGPATGVFTGQIQSQMNYFTATYDGTLDSWRVGEQNDRVEVSLGVQQMTVPILPGILRLVDASGADLDRVAAGDVVRVQVESEAYNLSPTLQEPLWISVRSTTTGDQEYSTQLMETGLDTAIFEGSFQTVVGASPVPGNGLLEVQEGETLVAEQQTYFGTAGDSAEVGAEGVPVNHPPVAVDDAATATVGVAIEIPVLANDSDPDGEPLLIVSFSQPTWGGSLTQSGPGTFTYTPPASTATSDSFTYRIEDPQGASASGTVTVQISHPPVAVDDAYTATEDVLILVTPSDNDLNRLQGDSPIVAVSPAAHGQARLYDSQLGYVTYISDPDYNGPDAFTYSLANGSTATIRVTVLPAPDNPFAEDDAATLAEDGSVLVDVLANDSDADGEPLELTLALAPEHGTASVEQGRLRYTPAANYAGADRVVYSATDPTGLYAVGWLRLNVSPVNDPPVAVGDALSTSEDAAQTLAVLANDSDLDGGPLAVTGASQPAHGVASFNASSVTYTPAADYNGSDSFTYTIADGVGGSATGTVAVTVSAVNDSPVAVGDALATLEDTARVLAVLANDGDVDGDDLSVTGVTPAAHGAVSFTASSVTYTPAPDYDGSDAFTYTIADGNGGVATGAVAVAVSAVNDPPVALPDGGSTREGVAVSLSVLANDSDLEGGSLSVVAVAAPAHGTATFAGGSVEYTPAANFNGTDSFGYTVSDGAATASATVVVTVAEALERVAVLGTHGVYVQTGADILSGDVIANEAGAAPFLNGVELSLAGAVTTPAGWDVEGNRVTIAAGTTVASDLTSNQLTNGGTVTGPISSTLALPVFPSLPALLAATPGSSDVNVSANGTRTLAPGSYRDLIVGKKGTVTFTGGTYHFRSISTDTQAKLLFSAAATVRVQQKVRVKAACTVGPNGGSPVSAAQILFHVGGVNGTGGGLSATPKALEIGTDCGLTANLYAPNGTLWIADRTIARGAFLGRDVQVGPNVQVTLQSAWSGQ